MSHPSLVAYRRNSSDMDMSSSDDEDLKKPIEEGGTFCNSVESNYSRDQMPGNAHLFNDRDSFHGDRSQNGQCEQMDRQEQDNRFHTRNDTSHRLSNRDEMVKNDFSNRDRSERERRDSDRDNRTDSRGDRDRKWESDRDKRGGERSKSEPDKNDKDRSVKDDVERSRSEKERRFVDKERKRDDDKSRKRGRSRSPHHERHRSPSRKKHSPDRRRHSPDRHRHSPDRRDRRRSRSPDFRSRGRRSPDSFRSRRLEKKAARIDKLGLELYAEPKPGVIIPGKDGGYVPNFCNPNYNPAARVTEEQIQKRRLLWQSKKEVAPEQTNEASSSKTWEATTFKGDNDGRMTEKFKRLMGMKGEGSSAAAVTPAAENEVIQKQEEMFSNMEAQYQVARMATHTHRGIGLGFGTFQVPPR